MRNRLCIFLNNVTSNNSSLGVYTSPVTYILTREELKSVLSKHKGVYWVESKDYGKDDFLQRWDKIGYGFVKMRKLSILPKLIRN